ncbi:hypothetical protein GCM10027456_40660 [Kineosporia babensis]
MPYRYVVNPTVEFLDSLNHQLAADPERLPSVAEFYPSGLVDLVETVALLWDQADVAPEGGTGDYRDVWHQDEYGARYKVRVWRGRVTGILSLCEVFVEPGADEEDEI